MKNMLNVMVLEYMNICAYLQNHQAKISKGYILVSYDELVELLDRNNYMPSRNKLHYWREMKWIDADVVNGKYVRKVKICGEIYREIQRLIDK